MSRKIELVGLLTVVLLAGCAQMQPMPLVFVSTNTLGVDMGADPASAQTPRLVLGYKSTDVALVPVTTELNQGPPIRGCYNTVKNMASVTACADGGSAGEGGQPKAKPAVGQEKPTAMPTAQAGNILAQFKSPVMALPLDDGKPKTKPNQKTGAQVNLDPKAAPPSDPKDKNSYGQSMSDSLSVFSSFNADAKVGAEGGVQLGKAFATGVAAQQLTEGINYYMQLKGQALASGITSETNKEIMLRTECTKSLIAAKDKNVPTELLPNCSEKSQQTQDELKAKTACVTALTAAVEKKVPEDKLPKCS